MVSTRITLLLLLLVLSLGYFRQHTQAGRIDSAAFALPTAPAPADTTFAALIERLSEPGGYFDSDNLISNEASYLHVLGRMRQLGVRGGAYVGVGPDQNFSYIAHVRPEIAFIIDIRRDNLLHHLLYKALFQLAGNRIEYLCLLFGRPLPEDPARYDGRRVEDLVDYIDDIPGRVELFEAAAQRIRTIVPTFGYPLSAQDLDTIRRIHAAFFRAGLDLRFTSRGRAARTYYPNFRDLIFATDLALRQGNYLAIEESFRFVKELQAKHLIVPVVGDLAGPHALRAIGREIERRGLFVSAFYTSNVEYYLMIDGIFDRYVASVSTMPYRPESVIIRSYFGRGFPHPQNVGGSYATQLLERFETFNAEAEAGGYLSYDDLVRKNVLTNR
jgi:hypothetical protein